MWNKIAKGKYANNMWQQYSIDITRKTDYIVCYKILQKTVNSLVYKLIKIFFLIYKTATTIVAAQYLILKDS